MKLNCQYKPSCSIVTNLLYNSDASNTGKSVDSTVTCNQVILYSTSVHSLTMTEIHSGVAGFH